MHFDVGGTEASLAPEIGVVVEVPLQLRNGKTVPSQVISFTNLADAGEHLALRLGEPDPDAPLVRLHSECVTGDVFGSSLCDCGPQLWEALERLEEVGGYLLYLRQEGRGIGLYRKLEAYALQATGLDTYEANRALGYNDDERDYEVAAQMLKALKVERINLLSNNPDKQAQLTEAGITVESLVATGVFLSPNNHQYLRAKTEHGSHLIDLLSATTDGEEGQEDQ